MYLENKTSEALESALNFTSLVLGFEIIQLWLEEDHCLSPRRGYSPDMKLKCVYSFVQESNNVSPNISKGYYPDIQDHSLALKVSQVSLRSLVHVSLK